MTSSDNKTQAFIIERKVLFEKINQRYSIQHYSTFRKNHRVGEKK